MLRPRAQAQGLGLRGTASGWTCLVLCPSPPFSTLHRQSFSSSRRFSASSLLRPLGQSARLMQTLPLRPVRAQRCPSVQLPDGCLISHWTCAKETTLLNPIVRELLTVALNHQHEVNVTRACRNTDKRGKDTVSLLYADRLR